MKEELNVVKFELPLHLDGEGGFEYNNQSWDNSTLYTACRNLPEFDYPLCAIDMSGKPWTLSNFRWILYHIDRINKSKLDYPIILTPDGIICDGWHRISKAILEGKTTIRAVRLLSMPESDRNLPTT